MPIKIKNQADILTKLNIKKLNPMQIEACKVISKNNQVVLLSPTGTGKTLAFLLPIIEKLDIQLHQVQALIVVPSRELAIQIEQVIRELGTGFKANAVYGGRSSSKDKIELKQAPAILVGTPGRIADHLRRRIVDSSYIQTLVLDEFDKSLEIGFDDDMMDILKRLPTVKQKILTSATQAVDIPDFVKFNNPVLIDYLDTTKPNINIKKVKSASKDKTDTLIALLKSLGNQQGVIFCNFKDTIQKVSDVLTANKIEHGCFFGGLEQKDRERALIKFRNGTHQVIIATDLAARGIDIPEIKYIIHFQLPVHEEEFTHRNGRTGRMHLTGNAFIFHYPGEKMPPYFENIKTEEYPIENKELANNKTNKQDWTTLLVSGGRKDKISKGDIAGFFIKQGNLAATELGNIEIKQDCAFVAVANSKVKKLILMLDNTKLKTKKVRIKSI